MRTFIVKINLILFITLFFGYSQVPTIGQMPESKAPQKAGGNTKTKGLNNRIEVAVISTATEESLKLQEEIIRQFSKDGQCPKERLEYYKWVEQSKKSTNIENAFIGWRGSLQSVEKDGTGYKVKMVVIPRFTKGATLVGNIGELYSEEYKYDKKKMIFKRAIIPRQESKRPIMVW